VPGNGLQQVLAPPPLFILKSKSFLILFFLAGVSKKIKKSREKN
jgi:hypothetical protein